MKTKSFSVCVVALAGLLVSASAQTQSFTRLVKNGKSEESLETRAVKLVPTSGSGPVIWLVGVAHIGQDSYYKSLQKLLDAQSLVLFEGVEKDEQAAKKEKAAEAGSGPKNPFPTKKKSMYLEFASAVGLDFQLDDIDYSRKTFKNCDLTWDQVAKLSAQKGKQTQDTVNTIGKMLQADSPQAQMFITFLAEVKKDPAKQQALRVVLTEALSTSTLMDKFLGEGTSEVLIQKRNAKVLSTLDKETAQPSIAIFYGAGHMEDMEHRIEIDRHYKLADSLWFPAITSDESKVTGEGLPILAAFRSLMGVKKP